VKLRNPPQRRGETLGEKDLRGFWATRLWIRRTEM
jgi:hypothetical protein